MPTRARAKGAPTSGDGWPAAVIELLVARGNAQLRALAALGAPISGGWKYYRPRRYQVVLEDGRAWTFAYAALDLRCRSCLGRVQATCGLRSDRRRTPEGALRHALRRSAGACGHLSLLIGPEPQELRDLAKLELLAGAAPGAL